MQDASRQATRDFDDPFGVTADPDRYVPREATERALEDLERVVREERSALLVGLPQIGKTLLLRMLCRRVEPEMRVVYLPYASLSPAALAGWALQILEVPTSLDPVDALRAE